MKRRIFLASSAAATSALAFPAIVRAQSLEKPKLSIAVGGKNLLYYLPLTVAESLGYFKEEGLDAQIVDFAGGSQALRAVVGGSADVVSGAFEHTVNMQSKGQRLRAFVLQGRAPQIVLGISKKTMPGFKSMADLKGKKIGVTAPGSSTNVMANFVLAKAGLKPADVSFIGVGATSAAIAAIRQGQIDALSHLDPVVTILERSGDIKVVTDTRIVAEADKVFGGPMPAACLYAPQAFIDKNPATVQALANAIVRAGYMFQSESLMPWRTAAQNVAAGLEFRGLRADDARAQAEQWLKRVGLGGFGDRYPHQLSGGMRKRTSLAQTLVLDPDIILMDEPFSALDVQTRQLMENEVLQLWAEKKKAVLFITHDLDEAIAMSDRVVVMSAGPASRPMGEFAIDLPRPRDVAEVRVLARFVELHKAIWDVLREEVLKGYRQQLAA